MDPIARAKRLEFLRKQARFLIDKERGYFRIYEREVIAANSLRVATGTTGYQGGDAGHGGQTVIELEDIANTGWNVDWNQKAGRLEIRFFGDSELDTAIEALDFIVSTLKRQRGKSR